MGKKTIVRPVESARVRVRAVVGIHTHTLVHRAIRAYYTHICERARGGMCDFSLFAKRRDTHAQIPTHTHTHVDARTCERTRVGGRCR